MQTPPLDIAIMNYFNAIEKQHISVPWALLNFHSLLYSPFLKNK